MAKQPVETKTIPVEIAAKMCGIGRSLAYGMCKAGTFPGLLKFGSRYVISRKLLKEYLDGKGGGDDRGTEPESKGEL